MKLELKCVTRWGSTRIFLSVTHSLTQSVGILLGVVYIRFLLYYVCVQFSSVQFRDMRIEVVAEEEEEEEGRVESPLDL